ncbi:hypothetical protein EVAR_76137_1 [Eumeta japonica]|uniref:Uncharacterized protein n=1 Tax=Eumeta variegata TaxID=151549 RepID=A0A4C1UXU6_EUMVA|nr:hypothetical protein EVAR_76137_1 [Eumeta japonica]
MRSTHTFLGEKSCNAYVCCRPRAKPGPFKRAPGEGEPPGDERRHLKGRCPAPEPARYVLVAGARLSAARASRGIWLRHPSRGIISIANDSRKIGLKLFACPHPPPADQPPRALAPDP